MKPKIWMSKVGEYGLAGLSRFCRFVNTQGGHYAAIISDALFSTGSQ